MQSDEVLIGTKEAAEIFGVDPTTIQRWTNNGRLPYVRRLPGQSGAILFDAAVVRRKAAERLLRRHKRQAADLPEEAEKPPIELDLDLPSADALAARRARRVSLWLN